MTIVLRVLSGSKAGAGIRFDKSVVAVGRHPMSDLRFDPDQDLDVSARHAELRSVNDVWTVYDQGSTNGTFVNGERIAGDRTLSHGDIVSFGANGPRVEVQTGNDAHPATPVPTTAERNSRTPARPPAAAPAAAPAPVRKNTELRVAEKVREQTQSMRRTYSMALAGLVVAAAVGFFFWQRQVTQREEALAAVVAHSDSSLKALEKQLSTAPPTDSLSTAALKAEVAAGKADVAKMRAQVASGTATPGSLEELSKKMARTLAIQQNMAQMDLPKIRELNDAAVAMVASDFDGKFIAGTAFGVTKGGLLVTNRHVVKNANGVTARRIMVIFANTYNAWLPVKIVRLGEGDDDDLALLQIDVAGDYPIVAGVSREGALARVGAPVVAIGYPGATDLPMEGSGLKIKPATTMTGGTVSKRLDNVIQLDSYSAHGASGSPLFDSAGTVVGVIYGGDAESQGRIVYAVPAQKLAAFLAGEASAILR